MRAPGRRRTVQGGSGSIGNLPAIYGPGGFLLTVTRSGLGTGRLTSSPAGIDTDAGVYAARFRRGTVVVLTRTNGAGSELYQWTGDGSGFTSRTVTMDGPKAIGAEFRKTPSLAPVAGGWPGPGAHAEASTSGGFAADPGDIPAGLVNSALVIAITSRSVAVAGCEWRPTNPSGDANDQAGQLIRASTGINACELWVVVNPTPSTNGRVAVWPSSSTRLAFSWALFENVDQAVPIGLTPGVHTTAIAPSDGSTTAISLSGRNPGDRLIIGAGSGNANAVESPAAGVTRYAAAGANNNRTRLEGATDGTANTIDFRDQAGDSAGWVAIGAALRSAG